MYEIQRTVRFRSLARIARNSWIFTIRLFRHFSSPARPGWRVFLASNSGVAISGLLISCSGSIKPFQGVAEPALPPANDASWTQLVALRQDNWFHLLDNGPKAIDWRLRTIDSATQSIDLQSFLLGDDPLSEELIHRLLLAADRGVRVRILMDDSFLQKRDAAVHAIDSHPNIAFRVYNPYKRRGGGSAVRLLLNLGDFSRVDHRMHNKLLVVDNRAALIGGRNLAGEYFGHDPTMNFRDLEVLTGGSHVRSLSKAFDIYWNDHWAIPASDLPGASRPGPSLASYRTKLGRDSSLLRPESSALRLRAWSGICQSAVSGKPTLLVDRPPEKNPALASEAPVQVAHDLRRLIDAAKFEVILISAYFIPTQELEAAVERAESRGVQIKILTNSLRSNNHTAAHASYRRHLMRLVHHGADLHELRAYGKDRSRHMKGAAANRSLALHAKALIIDRDKAFVGSCNLDARSLRINTEVGLLIESPQLNRRLRDAVELDFHPRNAWHVQKQFDGSLRWVGDEQTLKVPPAVSGMQRLEDWIFTLLPIEGEM